MQIVHFTPPQIAKFFNVNETTVKRWIQSGKLPSTKTIGGHYRVSRSQMSSFLESRGSHVHSSYVLKRMILNKNKDEFDWMAYYDKLIENDSYHASKILSKMYLQGSGISEIFDKIIIPTLKNIGEEWSQGRLDIVVEHRMSFQISQHISELASYIKDVKKKNIPEVILACVPGNTHVLPMLIGDLIFKKYGFRREVLGINVPIDQLEKSILSNPRLKVVCISNTYSTSKDNSKYINKLINLSIKNKFTVILIGNGWKEKRIILNKNFQYIKSTGEIQRYLEKHMDSFHV